MKIGSLAATAYRVPMSEPESDGTATWDHSTLVVAHVHAGDRAGFGWTYASAAAADVIRDTLSKVVIGQSALAIEGCWQAMVDAVRNDGRPGICSTAISAVDVALWDLKAKTLDVSLVDLIGTVRDRVPIYGSGGFTNYSDAELAEQLGGWAAQGISRVKMKIGRDAARDEHRVRVARRAIGDACELFVDANGGYSRKQALMMADRFAAESDVRWFEEPVSADDLEGLRLLRDRAPACMEIAAGEYGYTPDYFRRMLDAGAVDCLQADGTRCGGITGFLKAAALCEAHHLPLSAHCAPQLHAHVGCCVRPLKHIEFFHDHDRVSRMLFDGVIEPENGALAPDRTRLGHGIAMKTSDAENFRVR